MKRRRLITVIVSAVILTIAIAGYLYWRKYGPIIGVEWFQTGNTQRITRLQAKESKELEDNRIGDMWRSGRIDIHTERDANHFIDEINNLGLKWIRLSIDWLDWNEVVDTEEYSEYHVDPYQDKAIEDLVSKDIKIMYILLYWDETIKEKVEEYEGRGEEFLRFKTEEEIQNYLNYVKFIVSHFKGKIDYYEILNEPDGDIGQFTELDDYINIIKRVVPVIREEDPNAKIVVGAICYLGEQCHHEYLFWVLESDIMSLVDGISFHPMYGTSPEYDKEYYYNYPSIIQEIKDTASAHGFVGEYIAEELVWRTPRNPGGPSEFSTYSDTLSAKYTARGVIINLGMDITTGMILDIDDIHLPKIVVQNLCTIMAGAELTELPLNIESEATNIASYTFSLSNGDTLVALWTDGVAIDDDPGVNATVTIPNFSAQEVKGIDVLEGYQQSLVITKGDEDLIIEDLIVRDYPMILHIIK